MTRLTLTQIAALLALTACAPSPDICTPASPTNAACEAPHGAEGFAAPDTPAPEPEPEPEPETF